MPLTIANSYQLQAPPGTYKVAIIQPGSWGDNCNSTLMLKPIRTRYSNCHIDVYTSNIYASAFHNNPYINNIIAVPADTTQAALHLLVVLPPIVSQKGYDAVFVPHPMVNPGNWTSIRHPELGTNLICAWVRALEHADIPYDMPLETILRLTNEEIQRAETHWAMLDHSRPSILMEVHGVSGQSFWNGTWTIRVGEFLLRNNNRNLLISKQVSTEEVHHLLRKFPGYAHFIGHLSIRECAHIFNKCSHFFSVSSGLSNACNTNYCKKDITWIETTNSDTVTSAPIRRTGKIFWHDNNIDRLIQKLAELGL